MKKYALNITKLIGVCIVATLGFVASTTTASANITSPEHKSVKDTQGYITYVCGDSYLQDNEPNWEEHKDNPSCALCSDAGCMGTNEYVLYKCDDVSELSAGGYSCDKVHSRITSTSTVFYNDLFIDKCSVYRLEAREMGRAASAYQDFVIFKGSGFNKSECDTSTTTGSSTASGGSSSSPSGGGGDVEETTKTTPATTTSTSTTTQNYNVSRVNSGKMVYVCGDSNTTDNYANWNEHNLNPLCQGCTDQGCSGARVDVYKCNSQSEIYNNSSVYECRNNRIYSGTSVNYATILTDSSAVYQIDVYDSAGKTKDFVIWKGDNFGQGGGDTDPVVTPTSGPRQPKVRCERKCTTPGGCPFYAPNTQQTFPDVPITDYYFISTQNLECENTVHGYSDGNFYPNASLTRAQMAKIISNGFRFPENNRCAGFSDVGKNNKFYNYITTLKCNGIVRGYSDGEFKPNALVTRAEAATFIVNASRYVVDDPNLMMTNNVFYQAFNDVSPSNPHYDSIMTLHTYNIIDPNYHGKYYYPDRAIKREEMVLFTDLVTQILIDEKGWGRQI